MIDVFSMSDQQLKDLLDSKYFNTISEYFAKKEYDSWVKELGGQKIKLTAQNLNKIFDKCWQLWDTYNDTTTLKALFGREECLDNILNEGIDTIELVNKLNETGLFYTMHQYADYAAIYFDIQKGIIEICYTVDDCCYDHIYDDLFNGDETQREKTLTDINNSLVNISA